METYWVPGVNNLGSYGRWAFAEFTDVYEIESSSGTVDAAVEASQTAGRSPDRRPGGSNRLRDVHAKA